MSLDLKNTQEVISRFANKVIKDSKKNLVDKNASRELLKSLGYDLDEGNPFAEQTRKLLSAQSESLGVTP